jgi:hypothetical protein
MKHPHRRLLLICNSDPTESGVSEIFLRAVAALYPPEQMYRFSTTQNKGALARSGDWYGVPYEVVPVSMSPIPGVSSILDWQLRHNIIPQLVDRVMCVIRDFGAQAIWIALTSGPTIYLARQLMERVSLPIYSMVWDIPQYFAANLRLDRYTTNIWLRQFEEVLRGSRHIAVASEGMKLDFAARYQLDSVPILLASLKQGTLKQIDSTQTATTIRIAFAGSLYAKDSWNSFIKAIDVCDGTIGQRRIQVEFWGRFPKQNARFSPIVHQNGTISPDELMQALATCDMAYLPYSFAPNWDHVACTSFPTKLVGYLEAGLPVFYHGPRASTVTEFYNKYQVGSTCHSQDSHEILAAIDSSMDTKMLQMAGVARASALKGEFSVEVMRKRFAHFLDDDLDVLGG